MEFNDELKGLVDELASRASLTGPSCSTAPVGLLTAADLDPRIRAVGEEAARQAVAAGACAADLSSLHLLGLLTADDRFRIRSALPGHGVIVARSAVSDVLLTRDHVRNLSAAPYTASLAPDAGRLPADLANGGRPAYASSTLLIDLANSSARPRVGKPPR
jgi:hypothetical protein